MSVNKILVNNNDSNYTHSIFDISEYTGNSYSTLSDALDDIPIQKRKGGMTIRYIDSNDKYVQYRLVSPTWSTDIHDWTSEDPYFIDKIMQEVNEAIDENTPIEIHGDVTNAPDEEDLTSVNVGSTDVLKFKDKAYNPLTYSGLGRKILRKNIVNGVNTLSQSMINQPNTIYVIQYDFTLGEDITVPANCVLEFDGGSLSNGVLDCNNCGIEASETAVIFKSNLNIKGVREVCAAWIGVVPTAWNVDSGSDKLIHFTQANENGYNGFAIKFLKGIYSFTLADLLLAQYTKLIGAEGKTTKFVINAANDNFEYIFGVNRHCKIANIDLRFLSHNVSYTNCDIFRISNKWLTDIDAQDSFKINYDYSFENLWIKGNTDNSIDDRINGIGIRFVDQEEDAESLYPVRSMTGPQMCKNVMIEMVRAGIIISCVVNSGTTDASYVNGLVFDSIFIQGKFGFEFISSVKSGSSGHNYISNYLFQGGNNRYGIYGWCRSEEITNYIAWDSNSLGMAKGDVILSNARFTNTANVDTTLVNGFNKLDNGGVSVSFIPFKINKLRLYPTAYDSNSGVVIHTVDYSENYKRFWRTRTDSDHPYRLEETINQYGNFTKELVGNSKVKEQENLYDTYKGIRTILNNQTGSIRVLDYDKLPSYGAYQDSAYATIYDKQGFVTITRRVTTGTYYPEDELSCVLSITSTESLTTSFVLIKNIFFTGGGAYVATISSTTSEIKVYIRIFPKKYDPLINDVLGITFKVADRADGAYKTDETQSLWFTDKISYTLGSTSVVNRHTGTTAERPTSGVYRGYRYFDTDLNKPIWFVNSEKWEEADGSRTGVQRSGTWSNRPQNNLVIYEGFMYMINDTSSSPEKHFPIYAHISGSTITWYKADGTQYTG